MASKQSPVFGSVSPAGDFFRYRHRFVLTQIDMLVSLRKSNRNELYILTKIEMTIDRDDRYCADDWNSSIRRMTNVQIIDRPND